MGIRKFLISSLIAYGSGYYGSGYYGGYKEIKVANNFTYGKSINSQRTCSFTIVDNPENVNIIKGLDIIFMIDDEIKFGGIIKTVKPYEDTPNFLFYDIDCYTYEKLAGKRRISAVFENKSMGYITRYIVNNYLSSENIIAGNIQDGKIFDRVVFNDRPCDVALNLLQNSSPGYNWNIDNFKQLHFIQKTTNKSMYTINDSFQHSGFRPVDTLDEYRNVQYVKGGLRLVNLIEGWIPSPKPDGSSREFTVKLPIGKKPMIYINGVAVSENDIGVNGYDEGKKWYWSYNSDKISHDSEEVALTDSQELTVDFQGLLETNLLYEDGNKIQERAEIEGNSGRYEESCVNQDLTSLKSASEYAKGLIEKYKDQNYINLTIEDDIKDFDVNKLIKIEKPLYAINDWYLVESIKCSSYTPDSLTYDLKLLSGEFVGNWEDYLKSLLTQETNINADDVIINYKSTSEEVYQSTEVALQGNLLLAPSIDLAPSINLAPGTIITCQRLYEGAIIPTTHQCYKGIITSQSSYIYSYYPNNNYNSYDSILYWGGLSDFSGILVDFDLSSLVGENIDSAILKMYRLNAFSSGNLTSNIRVVSSPWNETTVTYNSIKDYIGTTEHGQKTHSYDVACYPDTWDITDLVKNINDGTIANYNGFFVYPSSIDYSSIHYYNNEKVAYKPILEVTINKIGAE